MKTTFLINDDYYLFEKILKMKEGKIINGIIEMPNGDFYEGRKNI